MRMNRIMEPLYAAALSHGVAVETCLSEGLRHVLDAGFIIDDDCVFLRSEYQGYLSIPSDMDHTQREMFVNHLHIENMTNDMISHLQLLGQGIAYASSLHARVRAFLCDKPVRVILSLEEIDLDKSGLNIAPERFSADRFLADALDRMMSVRKRYSCTVCFYRLRPEEPPAMAEDLNAYRSNAVLVFE